MREILFRAKRVDNGEWVEGDLHIHCNKPHIHNINPLELGGKLRVQECILIDPSTVGQYTGLTDNDGKRIFEGDLLFDSEWECEGHVAWANEHLSWMIVMSGEKEFLQEFITDGEAMCAGCTHIIGNIHDNPEELLEVSQ